MLTLAVQELGMTDEKLSGLFSLMKEVHLRSTGDRMALEPSFTMFKVRAEYLQLHLYFTLCIMHCCAFSRCDLHWCVQPTYRGRSL